MIGERPYYSMCIGCKVDDSYCNRLKGEEALEKGNKCMLKSGMLATYEEERYEKHALMHSSFEYDGTAYEIDIHIQPAGNMEGVLLCDDELPGECKFCGGPIETFHWSPEIHQHFIEHDIEWPQDWPDDRCSQCNLMSAFMEWCMVLCVWHEEAV